MTAGRRSLFLLEVPFGVFGGCLVGSAFLFSLIGIPRWLPQAPMVRVGIPSPLTGMTRSFVALAGGDVVAAFGLHPLGPLLFAACAAMPIVAIASWVRGRRLVQLPRVLLWPTIAAFATAWFWQISRS